MAPTSPILVIYVNELFGNKGDHTPPSALDGYSPGDRFILHTSDKRTSVSVCSSEGSTRPNRTLTWFNKTQLPECVLSQLHNYEAMYAGQRRLQLSFVTPGTNRKEIQALPNRTPPITAEVHYDTRGDQGAVKNLIPHTIKKEETTMLTMKNLYDTNAAAATTAATMEAGRIANNQIASFAAKRLPFLIRGYADKPLGKLVIANLACVAAQHFRPGDKVFKALTEAMQVQAYQELIQVLDIEGIIEGLLESPEIKRAMKKLTPAAE